MRAAKRVLRGLSIVALAVSLATAGAVVGTQTTWFKSWLRGYMAREANQYLNGEVSIGRLSGSLLFGVELEDVSVSMDGRAIVSVKGLSIDYDVFAFVSRGLVVNSIRIDRPVVHLWRYDDAWSISRLVKRERQEADRTGPGRPITISDIGVSDGSVMFEDPLLVPGVQIPRQIDRLDVGFAFKYEPVRYSIDIAHMSFRGSDPPLELHSLSGGLSVRQDELDLRKIALSTSESSIAVEGGLQHYLTKPSFNMQVSSDKLSLAEVGRIIPSLADVRVQPAVRLKLDGPLDHLAVDLDVHSSAGELSGQLLADAVAPDQSIRGMVSVRHLNLAPLLGRPETKTDVTAVVKADVQGISRSDTARTRGSIEVDAPRAVVAGYIAEGVKVKAILDGRHVRLNGATNAYGAWVTLAGTMTLPAERSAIDYDLNGRVQHLDLARLPQTLKAPAADTNLNASYQASGSGTEMVRARVAFEASEMPGAHIAPDSTIVFSAASAGGSFRVLGYEADVTASRLDLQRVAKALAVSALEGDRYQTSLNAHLTASGRGTSLATMEGAITGDLTDSTLLGGQVPQLSFDATVGGNAARVRATGAFANVDPGAVSGRHEIAGDVAGVFSVDANVADLSTGAGLDRIEGTASVTLQASTVGGLRIDGASLDAGYHQQLLDIRTLDLTGPDLKLRANGTVGLTSSGESNLHVHADSTNLEQLGTLVNTPLAGIGHVDATITGNRSNLNVSGSLTGDGLTYSSNSALTLSADYKVDVPNLAFGDATISATTKGTFVTLGGQHVNEVTAKTRYQHNQLDVDLAASQPQRSVGATGTVLLRPGQQELRLTRFDLAAQNLRWQLAPGTATTVRHGNSETVVTDLRLVSNDQQITVDGTFGESGGSLEVTLTKVDLADVDAILLRPAQYSGALDASGTISGTTAAPEVKANFEIAQGGFRQFKYQSFAGTVGYKGKRVTIDSRLEQSPTAWVHFEGFAPLSLFRSASAGGTGTLTSALEPDPVDLQIESSPIDLGVVQGFTTALTAVQGTAQANIRVTGRADDPHTSGTIALTNGSFKVEQTGVPYAHLNGRIDLQDDRLHIAEFTVLDNANASLSLTGDISIRRGQADSASLQLTARNFKILDNKMGSVRIHGDLSVAGDLRAPVVKGDLAISTGTINLDPILAATGQSAYATSPTEYTLVPLAGQGPMPGQSRVTKTEASTSSPEIGRLPAFDAVQMDVRVTVPDDLVVKSNELRTPDQPIGLGALNVTLGGDLRALKDPGRPLRVVGTVNTIRGMYDFQGRRFTILRDGLIRFEGTEELNPTLDVKTQRVIQGVQANANILGTMQRPRIELTSVPPLEQADILSLIVFNQPVNQLGEGQQILLSQQAQEMAVGAIGGQLSTSLGSVLNLSEFEIQAPPVTGATAQLTVGQQVGQNLYIQLQQVVGGVSSTNLILQYELTNWLRLQTNLIQAAAAQQTLFQAVQDSGFDLIFFFSF